MQEPRIKNVKAGPRPEASSEEEKKPQSEPTVQPNPTKESVAKLRADLDQLTVAGMIEEEFLIMGFTFKMRTLTAGENTQVLEEVTTIGDDDVKFSTMRYYLLARAIQSINGIPLEVLYKGTDEKSVLDKRIQIIRSWQQTFVNAIFEKYNVMIERSEKANEEEATLKN